MILNTKYSFDANAVSTDIRLIFFYGILTFFCIISALKARKSRMELNIMNIVNLETASADNLAIPDDVRKHLSLPSARVL